jgi:hypothetical protein
MPILQFIEIIGSTILAMLQAFLSLLPIYDQINGLQDQIVAAALGVPAVVISIGGTLFAIGKFVWRKASSI